ncbi:hypothetical protein [Mycolicibacterium sphagni]|uniref:hypothetical protein n=1 Tax=Mycolicibacterium sphagni TaxID=1786 RepID=UPI001575A592|nr:hypothetical protein [Mycolicibacterium sphagni]
MTANEAQLSALSELGNRVLVNRHHGIGPGAAHDEARAARVAAQAHKRGMTMAEIAAAMHLATEDIKSWLQQAD